VANDNFGLDPEQVKKAERERRDQEFFKLRRISDLRKLLKQPEFRRFFWELLSDCKVFSGSFTLNAVTTAFNEGARDVGIKKLSELNEADIRAFAQMQAEFVAEKIQRDKEAQKEEEKENA
jgi:hypothetical protein